MRTEITQDRDAKAGTLHRMLAVVAPSNGQAGEIAMQFAKQGEVVEAVWYASSQRLLEDAGATRFEAVILFPSADETVTDADETRLREAMSNTPIYRVG